MSFGITTDLKNPLVCARQSVLKTTYPILKWASDKNVPWQKSPELKNDFPEFIYDALKPGDIGLTVRKGELTNALIPGKWKHVGVYGGSGMVAEAVDPTTRIVRLDDFVRSKDLCCFVRPCLPIQVRKYAAEMAMRMGKRKIPYDYQFLIGDIYDHTQFQYCAEMAYLAYIIAYPQWQFKPRKIWGVYTVAPDDYYLATKFFEVIIIHDGEKWREVWKETYKSKPGI